MTRLLTSNWMTLPVSVDRFIFCATVVFWKTARRSPEAIAGIRPAKPKASFWEFRNPEADQLIAELKTEKKSLEKREHTSMNLPRAWTRSAPKSAW